MSKSSSRDDHGLPDTAPGVERESSDFGFPDEAQVRAFAEELLRAKGTASYKPVASERRHALRDTMPQARVPSEPERDTREPSAGVLSKTFPSAADSPESVPDVGECLSEDNVLAFVEGRLGLAELVDIHHHLDACGDCQCVIAEAAHAVSQQRGEIGGSEARGSNLRVGTVLADRYRIQRFIARGGMGEVYEAYDRVLRERIALKTVAASVSDSPRAVRRLMAEVQLARRVSHPNVCRIYDLGAHALSTTGVLQFLSMEFVEGISLGEKLERDGPMPVPDAVSVAQQLLSGLQAAHEAGILHRDFKPDNVMLRPASGEKYRAVIMDFGLARALDVDPARLTTGANQPLIGTLTYMAPEQVEGGALTAGTDIFAFGIVFFEMLTGCLPFVGGTPAATALKRLKDKPPAPSDYAPEVPKYVNQIVLRCLEKDPLHRYQSAQEVLDDLLTKDPRRAPNIPRPWSTKRASLMLAGSTALLLAMAGGLFFRYTGASPSAAARPVVASPMTNQDISLQAASSASPAAESVEKDLNLSNAALEQEPSLRQVDATLEKPETRHDPVRGNLRVARPGPVQSGVSAAGVLAASPSGREAPGAVPGTTSRPLPDNHQDDELLVPPIFAPATVDRPEHEPRPPLRGVSD